MGKKLTLADRAYRAADVLESSKWRRGFADVGQEDTLCMMEAIEQGDETLELYDKVEDKIYDFVGMSGTAWNDNEAKDKRDAVRMLRKVAKALEAEATG